MVSEITKNKYQILELIIIFIITLFFNLICNNPVHDEIWNYGFAYNIANGLIPYKDFNMVITPLFPIMGALFLTLFKNNLIIYYLFNSTICTIILYYMKKINHKSYYIPYAIFLFYSSPNYNILCMLLLYVLITLENKKINDYLIGIILGLIFITKQNIGIYLFIPTLFIKNIKKILKRTLGYIIPITILLIYLIINNCLYEFIDYTFLGISNFANKNINSYNSCLIIIIIDIIYLTYKYLKTKDINFLYILTFQGVSFPIIDPYHVIIPFIPTLLYFLKEINLNKKIIIYTFTIFITTIFSYNLYLFTTDNYTYPNNTTVYKYKKLNNQAVNSINQIKEYILKIDGEIFIIDMYAYLIKLEMNIPINKFDLLNDGNMGKNGEEKIINEINQICKKEKCTFLLNEKEINNRISQYNQDILKYVSNTYKKIDSINGLSIYINY